DYHGHSSFGINSPNKTSEYCNDWKKIQRESEFPAVAFLLRSFGVDYSCLDSYYAEVKSNHVTIIYLSNEAGRRNNRLTDLDIYPNDNVERYNRRLESGDLSDIAREVESLKNLIL